MSASREHIEQFDAFLQGKMSSEEQLLFESKLATDPEYEKEFQLHLLIVEGIAQEKEERFRAMLRQQRQDTFIGNNTWGKKFTIASAAIVVLGMLVLVLAKYRDFYPNKNQVAISQEEKSEKTITSEVEKKIDLNNESKVEPPNLVQEDLEETQSPSIEEVEDEAELDAQVKALTDMDVGQGGEIDEAPEFSLDIEDNEMSIRKDKLESEEVVKVKALPSRTGYNQSTTDDKQEAVVLTESVTIAQRNKLRSMSSREKDSTKKSELTNKEKLTTDSGTVIKIQYYKSPLNYKGYAYNSKRKLIQVYGLTSSTSSIFELNGILYLKNDNNYYVILPNSDFAPLKILTNNSIIQELSKE